jgi:hypothetical protein
LKLDFIFVRSLNDKFFQMGITYRLADYGFFAFDKTAAFRSWQASQNLVEILLPVDKCSPAKLSP